MPPSTNKDRNDLVVTPTPPTDDESAQWVRFTLKKLTRLAISTRLVSPGALDEKGLLCDERLLRDLDYMSAVIGGDLMYYTPRVLAVTHTMSTTALGGEDGELLRNNDDDDTTKEKADSAIDSTSDEKLLHGSDHERRQFQYSGKKQTTEHQQQKKKKCKVIWIKRGKDGTTLRETEMGEYGFLLPNESAITPTADEYDDHEHLKNWELSGRKSGGAEGAGKP